MPEHWIREFRRPLFYDMEPRFLVILLLSILIESVFVIFMARRPVPEFSDKQIARIQERFVNFVLGDVPKTEERGTALVGTGGQTEEAVEGEETSEPGGGGGEESSAGGEPGTGTGAGTEGAGSGERLASSTEAAEARRISRERVSREVSNRGLLALLTGTGSAAEGQAVTSVFDGTGGSGGGGDLDRVLSSVDGLRTQGEAGGGGGGTGGGEGVRGQRSGQKATIDDLVSEREGTGGGGSAMTRKGDLAVEKPSEVEGTGTRSEFRSPEAIQEVLLSHNAAIRYCYERELKRNPTLKGKVTVRITVAPDGSVTDAVVLSSTLENERVERCMIARIRLWKDFPPIAQSEGDVSFRQVYTFGF